MRNLYNASVFSQNICSHGTSKKHKIVQGLCNVKDSKLLVERFGHVGTKHWNHLSVCL